MNYFNFSKGWKNSRNIPKEALYKAMNADEKLKKLFVDNVERIRLEYLITTKNSNIEAYILGKERYDEIQVYSIEMRKKGNEERVLKLIHGTIPKSTIIEVKYKNEWKLSASIKSVDNNIKVESIETTSWLEGSTEEELLKSMDSTNYNYMNLKVFYMSIFDRIKAHRASKAIGRFSLENIDENASQADRILNIQEEMLGLKKKLNTEKHTFKRAEIMKTIKALNKYLIKLK